MQVSSKYVVVITNNKLIFKLKKDNDTGNYNNDDNNINNNGDYNETTALWKKERNTNTNTRDSRKVVNWRETLHLSLHLNLTNIIMSMTSHTILLRYF